MDKQLIESLGLTETVAKMRMIGKYNPKVGVINEYSFISKPILGEEGEENNQDPNGQQPPVQGGGQQMPQQGGGMDMNNGQQPPMDAVPGQGGQQPPMDGGNAPADGGMPPMDQGPVDGVGTDVDNGGAEDFNTDVVGGETDQMQDGDEVIDVDELTQAQDETEGKVDAVDIKLNSVLTAVQGALKALEANDQKIQDLRAEIARRNPTPEEKLNIRSQSSFPYNSTPKEYWQDKMADPNNNYDVSFENNNPAEDEKKGKYDILAQDVNNIDVKKVADSLDDMPDLDDYLDF